MLNTNQTSGHLAVSLALLPSGLFAYQCRYRMIKTLVHHLSLTWNTKEATFVERDCIK